MIILDVVSDSGLMHPGEFSPVKTKQNSTYPSLTTLQSKQKLFRPRNSIRDIRAYTIKNSCKIK